MVGRISVIPYGVMIPGITDIFGSSYSYYRVRIEDVVWFIAISPAVKSVSSVKKLRGVGNLSVTISYEVNGLVFSEEENLDLGYDVSSRLHSQAVLDLLKKVDRWELDAEV